MAFQRFDECSSMAPVAEADNRSRFVRLQLHHDLIQLSLWPGLYSLLSSNACPFVFDCCLYLLYTFGAVGTWDNRKEIIKIIAAKSS